MDLAIEYLEEDAIVLVKVTGIMDFEEHKRYAKETFSSLEKHNSHKVLVNMLDMIPRFTVLEIDDMPNTLIECGAKPEYKFAVLHDPPPPYDRGFAFFRNAASLKSIKIQPFTKMDEAYTWLKSEP